MAEVAMIAERFPVVRGDDHQRVVEKPLALELVEQPPELFIEEGDAIVVAVAGHRDVPYPHRVHASSPDNRTGTGNRRGVWGRIPKRPAYPAGGTYGSWASK